MSQKFIGRQQFNFSNGAIGFAPGGPFDCLGPWAKVKNCPIIIDGKEVARLTCYASGYADTYFSVPANTRYKGNYVRGYFTSDDGNAFFHVVDAHKHYFEKA